MRLLDTSSLELISVAVNQIPRYAILSHTWGGEHHEPTLQQLQELAAAGRLDQTAWTRHPTALKKGFLKIRSACGLALSQGYRYIWVDTVCIDRTSSAELSEAVNSMFKWYQAASICYVYLEDVDVGQGLVNPDVSRCRWFYRGWTLQELVAPANVAFYDYKWLYIGNKRDEGGFQVQLSRTTGVAVRVLSGAVDPEDLSVACRMSWAASRTTTRPEDMAYCLMGIFQVNMPLLYGEGSRAFIRLQEEILRTTDDQSLFAWKCPPGADQSRGLCGILAPTPLYFRETGHIGPSIPDASRKSAPSSMTNAGLHVQLLLRPINALSILAEGEFVDSFLHQELDLGRDLHTDFIAILDCDTVSAQGRGPRSTTTEEYCIGIRMVALGSGQFARVNSDKVIKTPSPSAKDSALGSNRYVYVKQRPAWIFPEIVVESLQVQEEGTQASYVLAEVYPLTRWDQGSKTLKSGRSHLSYTAGAFRYKAEVAGTKSQGPSECLDVVVLVSQIEAQLGNWNAVCLSTASKSGKTLQEEFDRVSKLSLLELSELSRGVRSKETLQNGFTPAPYLVKQHRQQPKPFSFLLKFAKGPALAAELDGGEVLQVATAWTTENVLNRRSEMDHLLEFRKRLASEVIDDAFHLTFRQELNTLTRRTSKIRSVHPDARLDHGPRRIAWLGNVKKDLADRLERVQACCKVVHVLGQNGGALDPFEQYFSNKLVTACIEGDAAAAEELVRTRLVSVPLETKTFRETFADRELGADFMTFSPIHWAAAFGYTDIVRLLADNGANKYSKTVAGFTTLHLAAIMGHQDLLKYLSNDWSSKEIRSVNALRHGQLNDTPAHFVAAYDELSMGTETLARLLLARQLPGDPTMATNDIRNGLDETPLHRAAAMNNSLAIGALSSVLNLEGGQLDALDISRRTPLWHAAAAGATDAVRALLDRSATVDAPDLCGRTPLHIACRHGQVEAARMLLESGADVNSLTTAPCLSASHFATLSQDLACLKLVIDRGGDPTAYKFEGLELGAIHIAAANGWLDGVRLLVENGCDPATPCSHIVIAKGLWRLDDGVEVARVPAKNALELATRGGHCAVVEFLTAHSLPKSGS